MIQIIPAVLANSEEQYKKDITRLTLSETLQDSWVHIDFADNKFVQNKTISIESVKKFPTNFHKEAHLMVDRPNEWVGELVEAHFKRIIFHIESKDEPASVIEHVKSKGLEVGIAINKDTSIEKVEQYVDKIDVLLIMTIVAGFQGQPFIPEMLDKVKQIKLKNLSLKVGVDGAVKDSNIKQIADSGVDFVTVGSYLLKGDTEENLEILWEKINGI